MEKEEMTMEIDRSGILDYQSCPRKRYWGRHHLGKGLQKKTKGLPLVFGGGFHEGSAEMLNGDIENAVATAKLFLLDAFNNSEVTIEADLQDEALAKNLEYSKGEQIALAEGLLRAWWLYEGESFLSAFEILEVEKEGRATLASSLIRAPESNVAYPVVADDIVLMFRPDALVRDKESGDLFVVSWKTCSTFGKRNVEQAKHDMQSISEVWGILQQDIQQGIELDMQDAAPLMIEGVLYKWIVKGQRRKDNWDGLYKQQSHLIYGWKKVASAGDETDWSWAFEYPNEEDPNKTSKLGKGWKKVPIWLEYPGGVKAWVEGLAAGEIFPRHENPLAKIFPQSLPVERRADEVKRWQRQIVAQEMDVAGKVNAIAGHVVEDIPMDEFLDIHFPMHTARCHDYGAPCPFVEICHDGVPAEPGDLYQIRVANHPESGDEE